MSKLVSPFVMFLERRRLAVRLIGLIFGFVLTMGSVYGQDRKVPISFLPPPLENATYSLGIYEAKSGKLVRRLQEIAPESVFTVGLNGLMMSWDGKDEAGEAVAPGKYAARGIAVGGLKVTGVGILGNDWATEDDLRITKVEAVALVPQDDGLLAIVETSDHKHLLLRYDGKNGSQLWQKPLDWNQPRMEDDMSSWYYALSVDDTNVTARENDALQVVRLSDGEKVATQDSPIEHPPGVNGFAPSMGKDETIWLPVGPANVGALVQLKAEAMINGKLLANEKLDSLVLRRLTMKEDEPSPEMVSASRVHDKLYVLEGGNWQNRVRGLEWLETKAENGKQVSTWRTFFERSIHPPDLSFGLGVAWVFPSPSPTVEIALAENPLSPGKSQRAKLTASSDEKGSYLATSDGLRLRQISQRAWLRGVKLVKGKSTGALTFFQTDGAAWDEFSIEGAKNMMAFDAGEIEMTTDGEKVHSKKAAEPPDL